MNPLDMVFLGILAVSLIYSTWKGFVRDVFSLVGIAGGFFLAARFYPHVAGWLRAWVGTPWVAALVGCVVVFLATFLGVSLVGRMLGRSLKLIHLGWLDRTAGFGFGLVKGAILCMGLVLALASILPSRTPILAESRLAPVLIRAAKEAGKKLPGQVGEWLRGPGSRGLDRDGTRQAAKPDTQG
jgi:membrane protein required for colicin V production